MRTYWLAITVLASVVACAQGFRPGAGLSGGFAFRYAPGEPVTFVLHYSAQSPTSVSARFQSGMSGSWMPVNVLSVDSDDYLNLVTVLVPLSAPQGLSTFEFTVDGEVSTFFVQIIGFHYQPSYRSGFTSAVLAQQYSAGGKISENKMTNPARPGDIVSIFGAGLGARPMDLQIELNLGGQSVPTRWVERLPNGLDRLNFKLPVDDAPIDCYVYIRLSINHSFYSGGLLSTADGTAACPHRLGLTSNELKTLDDGSLLPVVSIFASGSVSLNNSGYTRSESLHASLSPTSAGGISAMTGVVRQPTSASRATCTQPTTPTPVEGVQVPHDPGSAVPLDPRTLTLTGSSGQRIIADEVSLGVFDFTNSLEAPVVWSSLAPARLTPGLWTVALPADLGYSATTVPVQIPRQIELTEPIQIPTLTQDFRARWNGSVFRPGEDVSIYFFAADGTSMSCTGPLQAGELVVAASNLTWLKDSPRALAYLSVSTAGASQPFRIQQAGKPSRPGVFSWGQTITINLK